MVQLVVANLAPASWLALLYFLPLSYAGPADAQRIDALGPQVRKYLRVSTPKVILEHVQVIDGTKLSDLLSNQEIAASALLDDFYAFAAGFTGGVFVGSGS